MQRVPTRPPTVNPMMDDTIGCIHPVDQPALNILHLFDMAS